MQSMREPSQVTPYCHDPGIQRVHTLRCWYAHLIEDISTLPGMMYIHHVEQTDKGKVFTCMFNNDQSCTIHPLNSVELVVVDKHQDTNINIKDFVIVKYKGTFYPG